jgi:hypothetical protein
VIRTRVAAVATELSILLVALTTACSFESAPLNYFDPTGEVYVSPEFAPEQTDVVLGALTSWNAATHGEVKLHAHVGIGSPQIRPAQQRDGVMGEFIASGRPEIVLDVTQATDARALRSLTLHELGHALGLQHIERVDSIMFPLATVVQEIDPWTLAAWQRLSSSTPRAAATAPNP